MVILLILINVENFSTLSRPDQANAINSTFLEPLEVYKLHEPLAHLPLEEMPKFLSVTEERVQKVPKQSFRARQCAKLASERVLEHSGPPHHTNPQCIIPRAAVARHPEDGRCNPPPPPPIPNSKEEARARFEKGFDANFVIHGNSYGAIPKSSTTMVLVSMFHALSLGTDGNGATVRTMLFDYRKAFDFIDHSILIDKLCKLDISRRVVN